MNRILPLVLSLLSALLLSSTAEAFSHAAAASNSVGQFTTSQSTPFTAFASATNSGQSALVRHLQHPLSMVTTADAAPSLIASQEKNSGWLIGLVIVVGGIIFGLAHLRKS